MIARLIKFLLVLSVFLLISVSLYQIYCGYEKSVWLIAVMTHSTHKYNNLMSVLTLEKLRLVLVVNFFIVITLLYLIIQFDKYYFFVKKYVLVAFISTKNRIVNAFNDKLFVGLLILPLFVVLYCAITVPITNDEAATYLNYSSRSILSSISYYSFNNHILNSVLTNITLNLPFPILLALRLPSVIAFVATLIVFYSFVKEYFTPRSAYYALAVLSCFYFSLYYGFVSRGYSLLSLFYVLSLYAAFKIRDNPERYLLWTYFVLFNSLGFYAIPTFLYPFVATNVWLVLHFKKLSNTHIVFSLLTVTFVFILYTPVLIVSGFPSGIPQHFSIFLLLKSIPAFLDASLLSLTGINSIIVYSICFIGMFVTQKKYQINNILLISVITLIFLLLIQSALPFYRNLIYINYLIALYFGQVLYFFIERYLPKNIVVFTILFVAQGLLIINFFVMLNIKEKESFLVSKNISLLVSGKSFLTVSRTLDNYLLFYLRDRDKQTFRVDYKSPVPYLVEDDMNAHDYLLIDDGFILPTKKVPIVSNDCFSIYSSK